MCVQLCPTICGSARFLCLWISQATILQWKKKKKNEYWIGLQFLYPGDLPHPGIKSASPALAGGFFTTKPPGKPQTLKIFL